MIERLTRRSDRRRLRFLLALSASTGSAAAVFLSTGAPPALADSGSWCSGAELSTGQTCFSGWESDLRSVHVNSYDSYSWAWLYNQANSGESNSGDCTSSLGCTVTVYLPTAGHGYQEMEHYENFGPQPDTFFGGWSS